MQESKTGLNMEIKTYTKPKHDEWADNVQTQFTALQLSIKEKTIQYCSDRRMNHSLNMIRNPHYAVAFNKAVELQQYMDILKLEHGKWN